VVLLLLAGVGLVVEPPDQSLSVIEGLVIWSLRKKERRRIREEGGGSVHMLRLATPWASL
jgi:hypothetical protein